MHRAIIPVLVLGCLCWLTGAGHSVAWATQAADKPAAVESRLRHVRLNTSTSFGAPLESPRPTPCMQHTGVWQVAEQPALQQACLQLARAYSLLVSSPAAALKLSKAPPHERLQGEFALLRARASLRLARPVDALKGFRSAGYSKPARLPDSATLHEFALAATLAGDQALAFEAYTLLVPRASSQIMTPARMQRIRVEAAMAALRLGEKSAEAGLAYLAEARPSVIEGGDYVRACSALLKLRLGRPHTLRADAGEVAERLRSAPGLEPYAIPKTVTPEYWRPRLLHAEYWALVAAVSVTRDEQIEAWSEYLKLAASDDPWRPDAQRLLSKLRGGGG